MAEAKVSNTKTADYDPWLMDDSCPYDIYDLERFPLSKELEAKIDAIANEVLGPVDEVQPAA